MTKKYCESFMVDTDRQRNLIWHKSEFVLSFYVPLCVILYCTVHIISHLRGRQLDQHAKIKKALCVITVVVVLFIICFLPSNITQLLIWIKTRLLASTQVCSALENLTIVFYITISLTYLNSMLDPVIYYFSSPVFKNICRKALHLPQADSAESTEKKTRETGSQTLTPAVITKTKSRKLLRDATLELRFCHIRFADLLCQELMEYISVNQPLWLTHRFSVEMKSQY
ncbi:hydroxycarboxylic acid receptor 2-like protein [Lates japonicus]|uniref:Hydroxycarboxylic acid receptor 2-like protein n=1 Tax=Lates japonicus TaxID=270547 RepID=A0AAD3R2U9_LATJO|nr:hydroxycarboxylic acid receptor 2-like protein [Lates japonicus]